MVVCQRGRTQLEDNIGFSTCAVHLSVGRITQIDLEQRYKRIATRVEAAEDAAGLPARSRNLLLEIITKVTEKDRCGAVATFTASLWLLLRVLVGGLTQHSNP